MRKIALPILSLLLFANTAIAQVVISDDDFAGWEEKIFRLSGHYIVGGQEIGSGNPGNCYKAHISIGSFGFGDAFIAAFAADQPFDLSTVGGIENLSFQLDLRHQTGSIPAQGLRVFPMVRQGFTYFVPSTQELFPPSDDQWYTYGPFQTLPNASDFNRIAFGSIIVGDHPNFGPDGLPLTFGYYIYAKHTYPAVEESNIFLDNFSVSFDVIPPKPFLRQSILRRGLPSVFRLKGNQPFEDVFFYVSKAGTGLGPCLPQFGNLCLEILSPVAQFGHAVSDTNGVARYFATIPSNMPIATVYTQAVTLRGVGGAASVLSNTVSAAIHP